jgi:Zn-dependent M28 family amino/carboxypeptidase
VTPPRVAARPRIESLFSRYFASQKLATEETPFDGRSEYGPFIGNGAPAGGLFTGAEDVKTAEEAATYGGTAGEAYHSCYHQDCDDRHNVSLTALDQMTDAGRMRSAGCVTLSG